jgi:N,N-dimethylformamidase
LANIRPDYVNSLTSAPRHFSADLCLLGWLERRRAAFDVVTDEDLHSQGEGLLARYRTVVTGNHPEYLTEPMLRALASWTRHGGHLMYMGGNGFYWVASIDTKRPHLMEVRRGHAGSRPGSSEPGEEYHGTTGEHGGLWRHRGRAPQRLVGVGYTAAGFVGAAGYRKAPGARLPSAAFVFEGVDDEIIGDFGPMGGAAGDELDRYDLELGTPPEAVVLASSRGRHSDLYQGAVEDAVEMSPGQGGQSNPRVRADLVLMPTPGGGAVFSVGSIAWCLSLSHNGDVNNVSRITANVLERFSGQRLDRAPTPATSDVTVG